MKLIDLTGMRFGRLLVLGIAENYELGHVAWNCLCDCGRLGVKKSRDLRDGSTKSCGCLKVERASNLKRSHGMCYSSVYEVWSSMLKRCNNPNCTHYKNYGGRGIKVCKRWLKFENFYKDMGDRPKGLSLDRINNDKGYSKKNCRWATWKEQCSNKRDNVWITYQGQTKTVIEWSRFFNIERRTIADRYKNGHNLEDVFSKNSLLTGKPISSHK